MSGAHLPANHSDCKKEAIESLVGREQLITQLFNSGVASDALLSDLLRTVRETTEICVRQQTSCRNPCTMSPFQPLPHMVMYGGIIEDFINRYPTTVACSVWRRSDNETIFQRGIFFNLTNLEKQDLEKFFGPKKTGRNKRVTLAQELFNLVVHRGLIFGESAAFFYMTVLKTNRVFIALFGTISYMSFDKAAFVLEEVVKNEEEN
ncbi:hypothetical protein GCK72_003868 [Caenorhabditis remanei]|uniref:Uncharacterized protein n=1 Tax=Caenorhabditis remanei TaxID=31234 RepID=A0A6A5HBZ3_CAERE|nr:hypothetical protein GCK72_003868 [Caenorhabditis remanei]KAF1763922.1 hypothetical protein GCK72_003868 [Caenorhabditis remanei]